MGKLNDENQIYKSGIRDRGAFSYVIFCFWISLILPIIISLMVISDKSSFELFWEAYTTSGFYIIVGGVPLVLFIASFGLYYCKFTKSTITKRHLIYLQKNRKIKVSDIKWIEFQPIFSKGGYDCFKIYNVNGNSFYLEAGKKRFN